MELRTCDTTHFIQTIKGGLVQKVSNQNSNGRPVIRTKNIMDIYEADDARRLQISPSGLVFDHQQVEHERPCLLVADRTLWENNTEVDVFSPHSDDNFGSGSDDDTTLKQLRKRLLSKKRKCTPIDEDSQKDDENEKAAQDDSDLNEPLVNWKSKHSMTSKAKRKRLKVCAISSSTIDVAISPRVGRVPAVVISIKVDDPHNEPLGCLNKNSHASSIGLNDASNLGQKRVLNEYNTESANQFNYDDLEDDVPLSIHFSRGETSVTFKTPESAYRESLDLPCVEVEKQRETQDSRLCKESLSDEPNADLCNHSRSSSSSEDMPEERCISGTQVSDMDIVPYDKNEAGFTNEPNDSESCVDNNCDPNLVSVTPSKTIVDKEQPSKFPVVTNELNSLGHIEDELVKAVDQNEADFTNEPNDSQSCLDDNCDPNLVSVSPLKAIVDKEQPSKCPIVTNELNSQGHIEDELVKAVDQNEADFTNEPNDSQSCLDDNCDPNLVSVTPSKTIIDKEQPSKCPIVANELSSLGHIEDELVKAVDQNEADFTNEPIDSQSSLHNNCDPNLVSITPSKFIVDKEQPSKCPIMTNELNSLVHIEDELVKAVDQNEADFTNELNDSQSSLDNNCDPNLVSVTPSKTIVDKEQPSKCPIGTNELSSPSHIEDELVKAVDIPEASLESMTCGSAEKNLSLKTHQPSERLLSSRKAFPPSSQEQLRLALSSDEDCNDSNRNIVLECKEKFFENQNEKNNSSPKSNIQKNDSSPKSNIQKNNSSPKSNIQNDEVMVHRRHSGEVSQRKGPRRILRKTHSLVAKGNLEGSRFSRTFPNISSAFTSVQGCSEGAIAFSQRQTQDIETVAEKLMKELKSMKDIVEQKLLFEGYRNASLKKDADEVKLAITNATKAEEMGKRYMSMITRDCTRFCKIMKMTPESTRASEDTSPREKRKIRFADEAGGQLCYVKYFDDDEAAPEAESDAPKQM